jgi:regulator of cell morphogenesis and NO signaling
MVVKTGAGSPAPIQERGHEMIKTINEKMTVGELVAQYPQTRKVLEKLGIDYCCGGKHDIRTAAAEKSVNLDTVLAALNEAIQTTQAQEVSEQNWTTATLAELADHIEAKHHTFMKEQLPRLSLMLAKVKRAHGDNHGQMLTELEDVYLSLREEIEAHLMKEEQILFPYIRQIEAYAVQKGPRPQAHCGTVANPITQMEHEHESAGRALERMRELTNNYVVPDDGCMTFATLYEGLAAMEDDLHEHIHLENSILFPKAIELEAKAGLK